MTDKYTPQHSTESFPQSQPRAQSVTIRNLYNDRTLYGNYPTFQRKNVWPAKFKRSLIDSILRGLPISALLTFTEMDREGIEKYWIIDGQQRLSTVYDFMDGRFATASLAISKQDEPNSLPPIEPGKYYNQLSPPSKNIFNAYTFIIHNMETMDKPMAGLIFRRVQHHSPLTAAEKLASYASAAKDYALLLQQHSLWKDFYIGIDNRNGTFQSSLSLLVLEAEQGYANLNATRLNEYASGAKDSVMTRSLYEGVEARLEIILHVFAGTTFTNRYSIIPMYQAIIFLEKEGYTFVSSDKALLTSWFGQVLNEATQSGGHGFAYPHALMTATNRQYGFWEEHLSGLIEVCKNKKATIA